jgi:hypothetical protein
MKTHLVILGTGLLLAALFTTAIAAEIPAELHGKFTRAYTFSDNGTEMPISRAEACRQAAEMEEIMMWPDPEITSTSINALENYCTPTAITQDGEVTMIAQACFAEGEEYEVTLGYSLDASGDLIISTPDLLDYDVYLRCE